ncbi:hypothetical protein MOQ_009495 [Trypanosoma cruzi marinkellei]|uniref:Mon2 C-terminal domain-containing protein n=1 Tax=Trypanosoma cruzi marinkellei TaxID=85056 RepID=K2MMA3_TRYCR|nr:hypothetical protein MOQ_009495 [Trypanosoma cruzi marinkellei]
MSSKTGTSAIAGQPKAAALVATVFQTSLDNLLLAATRHRSMITLRDAVQSARIKGFTAEDIFHTFVLACDTLYGRRPYRPLLMQTLSDLGKMASLRMLPMSCSVIHVICHLVQKLLGRFPSGSINLLQSSLRSTTARGRSGFDSIASSFLPDGTSTLDAEFREWSSSQYPGSDPAIDTNPPDEELHMRILQTLMAYLSACEFGNAALADIMSILFLVYTQATPESMVEATCAATIEERTQALLRCLRNSSDAKQVEDDSASFTAQIQAVAYAKDLCALCSGATPKWLKLSSPRHLFVSGGPSDSIFGGIWTPPRRLRLLLLRTLITHFTESERIHSIHETNVFFTQYLNEDVVSLVVGCGRNPLHAQRHPDEKNVEQNVGTMNLVDLVLPDEQPNSEEFYLTQQLGVIAISKALPVMRHAMPILLRHHVMLVKLCSEGENGELGENARRMAVVLTLWQKVIADHEILQQLLLLTGPNCTMLSNRPPSNLPSPEKQGSRRPTHAPEDDTAALLLEFPPDQGGVMSDSTNEMHPFADLVTVTAELLSDIIVASGGTLNLDHVRANDNRSHPGASAAAAAAAGGGGIAAASVMGGGSHWSALSIAFSRPLQFSSTQKVNSNQEDGEFSPPERALASSMAQRHPATGQAADILSFLTITSQSFARVVEASRLGSSPMTTSSGPTAVSAREELTALFISLHSPLLRCFALAAQHLQGDDVIHMVLKGVTHLVQTSCNLALPAQRESYLQIFVSRLYMKQDKQILEGEMVGTRSKNRVAEDSALPAKVTRAALGVGYGRNLPDKVTPQMKHSTVLRRSLQSLQEKLYVLNCVISVANCMGASLGEGWRPVASCLLLTEPLLKDYHRLMEQQQKQPQYGAADEITLQDALRTADRVRDALQLLFINNALLPDSMALEDLLKSIVMETCNRAPSSYLLSIRLVSECCSLALMTVAAGRTDVSFAQLRRLWGTVKPLYLHVFDPVNMVKLVRVCLHSERMMEMVAGIFEQLVEDIAVVTAQFCQRLNKSVIDMRAEEQKEEQGEEKDVTLAFNFAAGPYATAALVTRLAYLCSSPTRIQQGTTSTKSLVHDKGDGADDDVEIEQRQLLASPTELLAVIYGYLQQPRQRHEKMQQEEAEEDGAKNDREAVETVTRGASLMVLKEVLKLVQGFGEELRGAAWEHLLHLLRHTAAPSGGKRDPHSTTAPLTSVKQSIGIAFRALETIQHSCITSLDDEGLRQLIRCGGAFMTQQFPGLEHRLNINLSAVQLLWSIADYVVSREKGHNKNDDLLWCTLLMQLYDGCLDVRPEVRQSALKTLFSLLQTYGGRLSAECWKCVFIAVLTPMMEATVQAANTCVVNSDTLTMPTNLRSRRCSSISQQLKRGSSDSGFTSYSDSAQTLYGGYANEEEQHIAMLLVHLGEQPALFESMRVTIMDAVCRVFVSHYQAICTVLFLNCSDAQQRTDREMLLRETISLFIGLCETSQLVARTTSGESAALSAVRALHVLMTAPGMTLLTENELESAWRAIEQLLHRDGDGANTMRKQCTTAVVSTIVTSLGDVVAMRIAEREQQQQQQRKQQHQTEALVPAASVKAPASSTFFEQLCHAFSPNSAGLRSGNDGGSGIGGSAGGRARHDYFPDYMRIVEESLCSFAVADSYFFPSRVQTAVIGVWKTLWPMLNEHERGAIIKIALQQFPSRHSIMSFITQGTNYCGRKTKEEVEETTSVTVTMAEPSSCQKAEKEERQISLSDSLPPGAHPSFLLALMDFFRSVATESEGGAVAENQQQKDVMFIAAPAVIRAAGVLLLLEYASPALLETPSSGLLFRIPADFFDRAERCLTFFLVDILWGGKSTPLCKAPSSKPPTVMYGLSASLATSRRESLVALAFLFSSLVSLANNQLGAIAKNGSHDVSTHDEAPEHLRCASQRLESLVLLIGGLIPNVIRRSGDLASTTELLSVLVPSSSLESPLLAAVAKRSLDVLRRWSVSSSPSSPLLSPTPEVSAEVTGKDTTVEAEGPSSSRQKNEDTEGPQMTAATSQPAAVADAVEVVVVDGSDLSLDGEELSSRLKSVARASMGARNLAVLQRFLSNTANEETRQMMKTTLQTIVLLYPPNLENQKPPSGQRSSGVMPAAMDGNDASDEVKNNKKKEHETGEAREVLQGILVELARLVEHTGDDAELRSMLSRAMLGICASLGFVPSV